MSAKSSEDMIYKETAKQLGIPYSCAVDVVYLRTRNRWTPALEKELIDLHMQGKPPDMNTFGVTPETQAALMDEVKKILAESDLTSV